MPHLLTLIVPYYRNVDMLRRQLAEWRKYPQEIAIVVVDDGSPEAAFEVLRDAGNLLRLYRVGRDIPWNRGGARNLGTQAAETEWIMHVDIDHVLHASDARALVTKHWPPNHEHWYRFRRFRVGRADATRRKDTIPDDAEFGEVKPHGDSYLCRRELYWSVGGYDEDYSGCLGGGSPFLQQLERAAPARMFHDDVPLHVYTRDRIADASDVSLSRDTTEYSRRRKDKERRGDTKAQNPMRFQWERVL